MDQENRLQFSNTFVIEGPQPGAQEKFCACEADIAIGGGSFFGGKSVSLCMLAGRNVDNQYYNGVIFRRTYPEIVAGGGLWDIARRMYPQLGGVPTENDLTYTFPAGSKIKFSHLQYEKDLTSHLSSAYCFLGFDQLEEFTENMFFFLLSRNRPAPGYLWKCRCRATCNPRPGWLADLIQWWWDPDTGYPIKNRSGIIRYFTRLKGKIIWVDKDWHGDDDIRPMSITFIPSTLKDNPIGMASDPFYASKVSTMDHVSVERNLRGNWKISYEGGMFDPAWFKKIRLIDLPKNLRKVRYWDFAASEVKEGTDPDWTSGTLGGTIDGDFYIIDILRFRETPGTTEKKMKEQAEKDGRDVAIRWEEEKGSAGKFNTYNLTGRFLGYDAQPDPVSGDKVERAKPLASGAEYGHVFMVEGPWNDAFLAEIGEFPKGKKDQVDSTSGCMKCVTTEKKVWPIFYAGKTMKFAINWQKTSPDTLHYGAMIQEKNMEIYLLAALWDTMAGNLWVYAAKKWNEMIPDTIAMNTVKVMNLKSVTLTKLIGNEAMFSGEGRTTARLINSSLKIVQNSISLSQSYLFDLYGSMVYANSLFNNEAITVHKLLEEPAAQFSGWHYEGDKPAEGYGYCEALCLICSELKRDLSKQQRENPRLPDYHSVEKKSKENSPYAYQTA